MTEPPETTLTGNKLWIVVGILGFVAVLILIGVFNHDARTYIDTAVKAVLGIIPVIK
jgi:hypothetical protein